MSRRLCTQNKMQSRIAQSEGYLLSDAPHTLRTIRVSSAVAFFWRRAFMKSSIFMITKMMSLSPISVRKQVYRFRKFEIGGRASIHHTAMQFPFFILLMVYFLYPVHSVYAVVPIMSMTRHVSYMKTSYRVPCEVCKDAVADKMDYGHSTRRACMTATKDRFQQDACVSLLQKPTKGHSIHEICVNTKMTDCKPSITILCDAHEKDGVCHVI